MPPKASNHPSPLRYPGGKVILSNFMKRVVLDNRLSDGHYVEIYAGGAAIALELLFEDYVRHVHINDISYPLIAFWQSVLEDTDALCQLILDSDVSVEEWDRQRQIYKSPDNHTRLEVGFSTFFLNRTSRSGALNGGIIGGRDQTGSSLIDARYNKMRLVERIRKIARYRNRIHLTNLDALLYMTEVLPTIPEPSLVYLDPPYFKKGQKLYENHYTPSAHAGIAEIVKNIERPWLVSYDNCDEINELYADFRPWHYKLKYSAQERYEGSEVLFFSPDLVIPAVDDPTKIPLESLTMVRLL